MATSESFDFPGPAGRLEAVLTSPQAPPVAAAVVCHAHPLHGGMMHFKAVFRAAKALQSAGLAVLRFNFRGVGRSQGAHDDGVGEQEDARAALSELERRYAAPPVVLGGFSFGSVVALRAPSQPRLFVQGELDQFGPGHELRALVEPLPEPRELVVVPGANHFFDGRLDALQGALADWAERRPWESTGRDGAGADTIA
jgi:hypothetical protein